MKRTYASSAFVLISVFAFGPAVQAQTASAPAPDPAPAAAPAPAPTWSVGPIDFSGLVDAYYTYNSNHPASQTNQLYNFNTQANQFSLNMAKLTMSHDADPVGFRVDLGFGKAFDLVNFNEKNLGAMRNIEQAYVSLKPKGGKGFQVDFGKFVTSAGAEVIETKDNWNYSRSLLFAYALPYYHFGVRTTMPVGSHFTAGAQVVNGWNNVEDNNSAKTFGFIGNFTSKKVNWLNNVYVGAENTDTNKGLRKLYDTTIQLNPTDKASFYINYDYGRNKPAVGDAAIWSGWAVAGRFQLNDYFAFSPRAEWFLDRQGFATGTTQSLKEVTMTLEGKMAEGLLARLEYRNDWSDKEFFQRGAVGTGKHQNTVTLGIVAFFGPKR